MARRQPVLGYSRRRCPRQLIDQLPEPRHLERRQPLGRIPVQLMHIDLATGHWYDERLDLLLSEVRSDADDRRLEHRRMRVEHLLDLERGEILAAAPEHLLAPAHEGVSSVAVDR